MSAWQQMREEDGWVGAILNGVFKTGLAERVTSQQRPWGMCGSRPRKHLGKEWSRQVEGICRGPEVPVSLALPLQRLISPGVPGTHDREGLIWMCCCHGSGEVGSRLEHLYWGTRTGHICSTPNCQGVKIVIFDQFNCFNWFLAVSVRFQLTYPLFLPIQPITFFPQRPEMLCPC